MRYEKCSTHSRRTAKIGHIFGLTWISIDWSTSHSRQFFENISSTVMQLPHTYENRLFSIISVFLNRRCQPAIQLRTRSAPMSRLWLTTEYYSQVFARSNGDLIRRKLDGFSN